MHLPELHSPMEERTVSFYLTFLYIEHITLFGIQEATDICQEINANTTSAILETKWIWLNIAGIEKAMNNGLQILTCKQKMK